MRIPYMVVIGEKETSERNVAVRDYATKEQKAMSTEELIKLTQL